MPSGAALLPTSFPALRSEMPGARWPAVVGADAATMLGLQYQFRLSERAAPETVRASQMAQIGLLAAHAHAHSAFWRERLTRAGYRGDGGAVDWFGALPALTRAEAQAAGRALLAEPVPAAHGKVHPGKTSGSTGTPLEYFRTDAAAIFWHAITLRDALWHARDLTGKLAAIRVGNTRATFPSWGPAYAAFVNGPGVTLDARDDINAQVEWLVIERPQYLLTHASNLRALAQRFIERGLTLGSLLGARSYSERLPDDLPDLVRRAWGVGLTDMYTANEVGYIALQCPDSGRYHAQSEDVLVEVVDESGNPCSPGTVGRVLVTSLHNFAMPLLRYDIGDYAEAGGPCACGRTLPVLERIMGRTRNMMRLPGGGTAWPGFPLNALTKLAHIRQFRMIQHSLVEIEALLVLDRPLTPVEEKELREAITARLRHPFEIRLTPVERIECGPGYKIEDFECRIA